MPGRSIIRHSRPAAGAALAAGQVLVSLPRAWRLATEDARHELVQLVLVAVGCDVASQRVAWAKSRPKVGGLFYGSTITYL